MNKKDLNPLKKALDKLIIAKNQIILVKNKIIARKNFIIILLSTGLIIAVIINATFILFFIEKTPFYKTCYHYLVTKGYVEFLLKYLKPYDVFLIKYLRIMFKHLKFLKNYIKSFFKNLF